MIFYRCWIIVFAGLCFTYIFTIIDKISLAFIFWCEITSWCNLLRISTLCICSVVLCFCTFSFRTALFTFCAVVAHKQDRDAVFYPLFLSALSCSLLPSTSVFPLLLLLLFSYLISSPHPSFENFQFLLSISLIFAHFSFLASQFPRFVRIIWSNFGNSSNHSNSNSNMFQSNIFLPSKLYSFCFETFSSISNFMTSFPFNVCLSLVFFLNRWRNFKTCE